MGPRKRLRSRERRAIAGALAQEQRQVATEIHDLVMQDLSLALANARALAEDPASGSRASTVVAAAERALAGAREVVGGLTVGGLTGRSSEPTTLHSIESCVRAAARRTPLTFDAEGVPPWAPLDEPTREALRHIAREAVTNTVKHARANTVAVVLRRADEWRLTIRDDGHGFDASNIEEGFGLTSMRRHAETLGGTLHVRSAAGKGTTVEAVLP
jgi:signal transduction histidine kinase